MKRSLLALVAVLAGATLACGADGKDQEKKAHDIINKKCTGCHGEDRVNAAFAAGKDMKTIQKSMEQKGAKLTDKEKSTLDFYWKQSKVLK